MPDERLDHCQDCQQHGKRGKEYTDLRSLACGNHIGREVLEDILKFVRTGSSIVFASRHVSDLGQGPFIDIPAKSTAKPIPAKLLTKPSTPKQLIITTIHGRTVICRS